MATLARRDAERLLRFVAEAGSVGGDVPFTADFLAELGQIVRADWIAYSELDSVLSRLIVEVERTGDAPSTVRKHLENVYGKLGVSTRTAAAARFVGLIDTEES